MSSLGDRIGRRRLLLIGAVGFAAASVLGALATAPWMLILSCALLGVAGATIMPSTLSLIRNMFLDRAQRRARWRCGRRWPRSTASAGRSWADGSSSTSPGTSPSHERSGDGRAAGLAPLFVPESRNPDPGRIDLLSIFVSLAGMMSLVSGIKALAEGKSPATGLVALFVGVVLLALFVVRQLRVSHPMIDVRLFRVRAFSGGGGSRLGLRPQRLPVRPHTVSAARRWSHADPVRSVALPEAVVSGVVGFVAAALVKRVAPAVVIFVGGFALLLTLTPFSSPTVVAVALCLIGLGAGVGLTLTNDIIMGSFRGENAGQAAAVSEMAYELGTALGTAVLGSVLLAFFQALLVAEGSAIGVPTGLLDGAKGTLAAALAVAEVSRRGLRGRVARGVHPCARLDWGHRRRSHGARRGVRWFALRGVSANAGLAEIEH